MDGVWFLCVLVVLGCKHRVCVWVVWVRRSEYGRKNKLHISAQREQEYNGGVRFEHKAFPTLHNEINHDLVRSGTLWEGCM